MTYLSLSNSWVTHSIPLSTLSSPFLAHLCVIMFRMSYTLYGYETWPVMSEIQCKIQTKPLLINFWDTS
jgi:hypothetical protein